MVFKKFSILFILIVLISHIAVSQEIHELLDEIKSEYKIKNYYSVVNHCREILTKCEEYPVSECFFTNVMKSVYRYKGLAEYEIYKKELKAARLENSIESLKSSYQLYRDAEILYMHGYLIAIQSVLMRNTTNLEGLITAWKGILELYGNNSWNIDEPLIEKIKDYIKIAEKFTTSKSQTQYTGNFARFMIIMACNLAFKGDLNQTDKIFFTNFQRKYNSKKL